MACLFASMCKYITNCTSITNRETFRNKSVYTCIYIYTPIWASVYLKPVVINNFFKCSIFQGCCGHGLLYFCRRVLVSSPAANRRAPNINLSSYVRPPVAMLKSRSRHPMHKSEAVDRHSNNCHVGLTLLGDHYIKQNKQIYRNEPFMQNLWVIIVVYNYMFRLLK